MSKPKASAESAEKWLPFIPGAAVALVVLMMVLTGVFDWAAFWWGSRIEGLMAEKVAIGSDVTRGVFAAIAIAAVGMAAGSCARAREAISVLIAGALCVIVLAVALPMLGFFVEPLSATIGIIIAGAIVVGFYRRPKGRGESSSRRCSTGRRR